jgi:hypothetical protein
VTPGRDSDASRAHPATYVEEVPINRSEGEITRILEVLARQKWTYARAWLRDALGN